jgi:monofunctional biosynthetic peptidoglycan transglycosylase
VSAKGRDRCEKRTSQGGDSRRLTPCLSPRITAVLPGPRRYNAGTPGPYVRRRAARIQASARVVRNEGLAACVL